MCLGSNGVDRVCSSRKTPTCLRGTNFCTSSKCFAPSFVRQLNGRKCTQTVQNAPKHEFRIQWIGSSGFVAKNSDATSWHELFATKAPDPPHWTLNSCFVPFPTIWVHLGPFGCIPKLRAKQSELVQKFVPRRRVGVFRDERTRSTPLDHKLTFWCISYYLGAFGTVWLPYETRCKTGRTSAKVRATKSHRNFSR